MPFGLFALSLAAHTLGSLSTQLRALAAYPEAAPARGTVRVNGSEICVQGHVTYRELRKELTAPVRVVPVPSCEEISVLGHLVSDGHGRRGREEVWLRDVLTRVKVGGAWVSTPNATVALDWTLGASRGRLEEACFDAVAWAKPSAEYGIAQLTRRTAAVTQSDVEAHEALWMTSTVTVLEHFETPADAGWASLPDASIQLVGALADLPGVTAFTRLVPSFYEITPLLRSLVVVSGRLRTSQTPNPILAPCSVHAEDAAVRMPWSEWTASLWKVARQALGDADASCSLIVKRAYDRAWATHVAVVDVQAAVGREAAVAKVVDALCERASRCVLHVGKSLPARWAKATFTHYYAGTLGVPVDVAAPAACYHPFCTRADSPVAYTSLRSEAEWYLL